MTEQRYLQRVLVDTGPLVAIFNETDQFHAVSINALEKVVPPLLTTWFVIAEAAYLLRSSFKSVEKLLAGPTTGLYRILPLGEEELPALASLIRKYRNLRPQLADVSLVHLAGRESLDTIFTLDRRDFGVFRTAWGKHLTLLP